MYFSKEKAQGFKRVKILGYKFTIRKLNPLLDFELREMPQLFTDFVSARKVKDRIPTETELLEIQKRMYRIIEAGLVEPRLVPIGKGESHGRESGITVEDLFRIPDIGYKLAAEIVEHSLNRFRGLRGLFFSTWIKWSAYITLRKNMGGLPSKSFSPKAGTV